MVQILKMILMVLYEGIMHFPTWGDFKSKEQKIWKNMINPFNYEDSNTWQGRYK